MNEAAWKRLLNLIRDGNVVPVVGPQLLGRGGPTVAGRAQRGHFDAPAEATLMNTAANPE